MKIDNMVVDFMDDYEPTSTQARVQEFVGGGGAKSESLLAFQFFMGGPAPRK